MSNFGSFDQTQLAQPPVGISNPRAAGVQQGPIQSPLPVKTGGLLGGLQSGGQSGFNQQAANLANQAPVGPFNQQAGAGLANQAPVGPFNQQAAALAGPQVPLPPIAGITPSGIAPPGLGGGGGVGIGGGRGFDIGALIRNFQQSDFRRFGR